jgi:hypothetical protein
MDEDEVSLEEMEEYNMVASKLFRSEEDGYKFYNEYARCKGFSIRRDKVKRFSGTELVFWRRFYCSCEGYRTLKNFERTNRKREPRALTRCGCKAMLEIELNGETGMWFVSGFEARHSHRLANLDLVAFLRSHREVNDAQKAEAVELGVGGLRTCQIMEVMENNNGGYDKVGFVTRDLYNFFARYKKKRIEGRDADLVVNHLMAQQEQDPDFFFRYSIDEKGRLRNLFWADSQSQLDYEAFSDVVIFDSTYRVNRYNLPFVPFVGANHHRSTVIFGCGILSNESVSSYVWLLQTLLEAMHQKHPKSLITDGDASMAKAIRKVMPNTDHRLCSWHIEENMKRHLRRQKLADFKKFLYDAMDVDDFERCWVEYKAKYGFNENNLWISMMYEHYFGPANVNELLCTRLLTTSHLL